MICGRFVGWNGQAMVYPIERQRFQEAYREGIFTRALGRPCSNPYPPETIENTLWEKGWRLIDAAREERTLDPFVMKLVPDFTPEKPPARREPDAVPWLWRAVIALSGVAVVLWLTAYFSLWR
jgi:hypothetical protein